MKQVFSLCFFVLFLSNAFAATTQYYCTHKSGVVQIGAHLDQVIRTCGKPNNIVTRTKLQKKPIKMIQWVYNYQTSTFAQTGQIKKQKGGLIVNFYKAKIAEMYSYHQPVQTTTFCNKQIPLKIGDTRTTVRFYCGVPSVTQSIKKQMSNKKELQTTLTYNNGSYVAPTQLIFENHKLVQIQ